MIYILFVGIIGSILYGIYQTFAVATLEETIEDGNDYKDHTWTEVEFNAESFDLDDVFYTTTHAYIPTIKAHYYTEEENK